MAASLLAGCHSAREFEYQGESYDTLNAMSIDNRDPYAITRDAWRLGLNRKETLAGVPVSMGATEDGSVIRFQVERFYFGRESATLKHNTERTKEALEVIDSDLEGQGYAIDDLIAVIDMDTPLDFLPLATTIGYKPGMPPQAVGAYIISQPGAYDALLRAIETRPEMNPEPADAGGEAAPSAETPATAETSASTAEQDGGG